MGQVGVLPPPPVPPSTSPSALSNGHGSAHKHAGQGTEPPAEPRPPPSPRPLRASPCAGGGGMQRDKLTDFVRRLEESLYKNAGSRVCSGGVKGGMNTACLAGWGGQSWPADLCTHLLQRCRTNTLTWPRWRSACSRWCARWRAGPGARRPKAAAAAAPPTPPQTRSSKRLFRRSSSRPSSSSYSCSSSNSSSSNSSSRCTSSSSRL